MLSNVTKSADVLRGATEMQDLWAEVEKETPHKGLPPPRQLQNHIMEGKILNEKERRDELERLAHNRQQKMNWYTSESSKKLKNRKSDLPTSERKSINQRLTKSPPHLAPRPKSPMNLGHVLPTGDVSPTSPKKEGTSPPKSRGGGNSVSSPGTLVKGDRTKSVGKSAGFEGLTMRDFYNPEWKPSFTYRPAKPDGPCRNCHMTDLTRA